MSTLVVRAPAVTLSNVSDKNVEAMINLLPDFSTGDKVHSVLVNKVSGSVPGHYSQLIGSGPSFQSVFFPHWSADSLTQYVESDTGLNGSWWNNFAVALLCQSIKSQTSSINKQMLGDKINNAVNDANNTLHSHCAVFYSRALKTFAPFKSLLDKVNLEQAKTQYAQGLKDNIPVRQLWYQGGLWDSPDWEMFNHYAKYMALGATPADVDTLIDQLTAGGLPIPSITNKANWRSYTAYLRNNPNINHSDIDGAASSAIHETTYLPTMGGYPSSMPEGNCYEFTANSQPGNTYREPPGHCCFSQDTLVLMADGTSKAIHEIQPGNKVASPSGPRTVTFVAQPLRGSRKLYQFGTNSPVFSGTHPFLNGATSTTEQVPMTLAVEPERLRWLVPTITALGIGKLEAGALVKTRIATSDSILVEEIQTVEEADTAQLGDFLYDLNLAYDESGPLEFWVGGKSGCFYLVSPEMPLASRATHAAETMLEIMQGLLKKGIPGLEAGQLDSAQALQDWLHQYGSAVCHNAFIEAVKNTAAPTGTEPPQTHDVQARIDAFIQTLDGGNGFMAAGIGAVFECLMGSIGQNVESQVANGWRDHADLGGDTYVLTVFDMALSPETPLPADESVKLQITYNENNTNTVVEMWDNQGRTNTRFHHYFDQLVHFTVPSDQTLPQLSFSAFANGVTIPSLNATALLPNEPMNYRIGSAPLRNIQGETIGNINFDIRRLSLQKAETELTSFSNWTPDKAANYAHALGQAMVEPLWNGLNDRIKKKENAN